MPSPLIAAAELAALLTGTHPPAVLDVRWRLGGPPGIDDHRRGHIPGSVFVDLETALAAPPGVRGRHPLPDAAVFEQAMRRAGVRMDRTVVVYDDNSGMSAARAWWLLRHHGHADVRLLDGGLAAWSDAGRPLETGDGRCSAEGDFTAGPGAMPVVDADAAASLALRGVLLDARAAERYRGEVEPIDPVAGHVPGARSLPTTGNVGEDGRFLPPEALAARFSSAGVEPGVEAGAYCGSGVTAAHEVLAAEVAGIVMALYPGSWSEWVATGDRPVATGEEPPRR